MSFPVETVDGEIVLIESKEIGADGDVLLTAEDGRQFTRSMDALKMQLKEAGDAIENVADEASEALGEIVEDVTDLVDAAEVALDEAGDVLEAAGDAISEAADDPIEAVKDILT